MDANNSECFKNRLTPHYSRLDCSLVPIQNAECRLMLGKCNENIKTKENLQLNQLYGQWYEVAKYRTIFDRGICRNINISSNPNNASSLIISLSQYRGGRQESVNLTAVPQQGNNAKWTVSMVVEERRDQTQTISIPVTIVDTDYVYYLIAWTCENSWSGLYSNEIAWIYVRNKDISNSNMRSLWDRIEDFGLKRRFFRYSRQSFCDIDED